MKIVNLVFEILEALDLYNSATIKVAEFEKELGKYWLSLDDLESGLVLYYLINESLSRLSYEYGKATHSIIRTINVNETYRSFLNACIESYITTIVSSSYTGETIHVEEEPRMVVRSQPKVAVSVA